MAGDKSLDIRTWFGFRRTPFASDLNVKDIFVFRQEFLYIIIVTFPHFYRALEKEHKASPLTVQAGRPA